MRAAATEETEESTGTTETMQEQMTKGQETQEVVENVLESEKSNRKPEIEIVNDPKIRFQVRLEDITLTNCDGIDNPVLVFYLGGNFHMEDQRHLGVTENGGITVTGERGERVCTGRSGSDITTTSTANWDKVFRGVWEGTSTELREQFLHIELYNVSLCHPFVRCCNTPISEAKIPLLSIASGDIRVTTDLFRETFLGRRAKCADLDMMVYFEEHYRYTLEINNFKIKSHKKLSFGSASLKFRFDRSFRRLFSGGMTGRSASLRSSGLKGYDSLLFEQSTPSIMTFVGTRSELESAVLHIDIDCSLPIDTVTIPFIGILDKGRIHTKCIGASGDILSLSGAFIAQSVPSFTQIGFVPKVIPENCYLCIIPTEGRNLIARDANGMSDPFVMATLWDGQLRRSRVVKRTINPVFPRSTFVFPLMTHPDKSLSFEANLIEDDHKNRRPISVMLFDEDEGGADYLGSTTVDLWDLIKEENYQEIDFKEEGIHFVNDSGPQKMLGFSKLFTRDLLEVPFGRKREQGGQVFFKILMFGGDFTQGLKDIAEQEYVVEDIHYALDKEMRGNVEPHQEACAKANFDVQSLFMADETGMEWFLPLFITPIAPPFLIREQQMLARLVSAIPWKEDDDLFALSVANRSVCMTTAMTLAMRAGDDQERSVLLASFFIGAGYNAWVAICRTHTDKERWFVIAEGQSFDHHEDILLFEGSTGLRYSLRNDPEDIPIRTVQALFSDTECYLNTTPFSQPYDLEWPPSNDSVLWHRIHFPARDSPFVVPSLEPKRGLGWCALKEYEITVECESAIRQRRTIIGKKTPSLKNIDMKKYMRELLELYEIRSQCGFLDDSRIEKKKFAIHKTVPENYVLSFKIMSFRGFSPKQIMLEIFTREKPQERESNYLFAVVPYVVPLYGNFMSVWVGYIEMRPMTAEDLD
ncbi:hypothetical protein PCE1_002820 [Barthelona sp. PCE]